MAAATEQGLDRVEMMEQLNAPSIGVEEKAVSVENLKEQPLVGKDVKLVSSDVSHDASAVDLSREASSQLGSLDVGGNQNAVYPPNIYAPQAQTFFYGGYDNTNAEWEGYPQFLNVGSIDVAQSDFYNENSSHMFHTSYGYGPQMPYGPYSPATTPLPNACGDGQLYSPQHFPFTGHYYQQPASPGMSYLTSSTPILQVDQTIPVDHQGAFFAGNSISNGMLYGPRPGHGFDGFGSSGFWSASKNPDGTGSLTQLSLHAASPQPIGAVNSFGQSITPLAPGMASQQQRSLYGYSSSFGSYERGYSHGGIYQGANFGGSIPSLGPNGRNIFSTDKSRRRGKGNTFLCSCNGVPDFLSEQNRGPRATRPKNSTTKHDSSLDDKSEKSGVGLKHELYNKPDFITEYGDARFFIIKSYSEDNVHKSIKYGVWASTINGNKKLDGAYREAKKKGDPYPVFLFFSVNASAQFCGLAEMIGAVDFEKSVDYWQQDKWTGQFPVKWHIIKDVPNNLFRHIILENNDNKPVTNSRDTQEVKLEQGLEMLSIFKKHESDISVLDDFDFYEERQKSMQERKARQQLQLQQQESNSRVLVPAAIPNEQRILLSNSGNFGNQFSKSFADAVRLDESQPAERSIPSTAAEETEAVEKSVTSTSTVVQSS